MQRTRDDWPTFDQTYLTASGPVSLARRIFPSLSFYPRFVQVVYSASVRAKDGRYDSDAWSRSSLDILRALEAVGVHFEMTGLEHLQQLDSPCVIVANHMSVMETVIMPGMIQPIRPVTFIVKESLMRYPVFKNVLATREPIVVNRVNPRQDLKTVMQQGTALLDRGVSVVVFPQTTRASSFDPESFNSLGIKLAARAKVPALPLALKTDAWGNGRFIKEFGKIDPRKKVHFAFGPVLNIEDRGGQAHKEVLRFIGSSLKRWQVE